MYEAIALGVYFIVLCGVAYLAGKYSPLVAIGGLLLALGVAKLLLP